MYLPKYTTLWVYLYHAMGRNREVEQNAEDSCIVSPIEKSPRTVSVFWQHILSKWTNKYGKQEQ